MSEKKNIDRLFQEKFKDFEVNPPEDAWANIEAKLDEKKKRRVIPFWWKLSGVAAVFLIGFLVSKSIYDDGIKTENPVVNESNSGNMNITNSGAGNKKGINDGSIQPENAVVNTPQNTEKEEKSNAADVLNKSKGSEALENAVAATSDKTEDNKASGSKNRKGKIIYPSKSAVAERKPAHNRSLKSKSNSVKEKTSVTESIFEKSQNQVAENSGKNSSKTLNPNSQNNTTATDKQVVQNGAKEKNDKETQPASVKAPIDLDGLKGNVNSKIATKEIDKKANDTASKNSVAKNELEELLNEKESKLKKESKINRWQLTSNVAPVFLGSVANGSPIDSTLSKNSKSYNTNVGYGIGVSYAVNKKLSIRTGLNKVNMSYNTNDITFFTGIQAKTLAAVRPTASSEMIHVESTIQNPANFSETGLLPFEASIAHKSTGYLKQEMGYLEMPVEMTYNLLDKKFGLKIIGGFSTLFLQDNSISIISQDRDTLLGEANNLNNVHFSTNLGVGFKYSFLKSFEFNVEPTVKYQMNTFNANAGNFKPYLFGIYSGISYKF